MIQDKVSYIAFSAYMRTMIHTTTFWLKKSGEWKSLSHVRLFATPWTVAYQAPPSMGFSRQEYWSGWLPVPAGKADQVPRTCMAWLRKGSRGSDTSPWRDAVWPRLYSASYIYTGEREKDKTVSIFIGWPIHLTKSHKKSWEHGNGTLLLFLTPDNISLCVRSLSRTPGVCSK